MDLPGSTNLIQRKATHIAITAYYNVDETFLQSPTAAWGNLWDCRAALRKLVSSVYLESDLNLPFEKKRKIFIPTWVYSCCVRHEENRSENCCIVFPQWALAVWDMDTATLYMVKYDRSH